MWTTSKKQSKHTRSNGTFNNIFFGISQLDALAHSTFFKDFVPSISSHGGILMFPQRNFGRINEDGRLHRVSSGTIKGRGFFTMMVIITTLQGTRFHLFHQTGNAGKIIDPNMPWEKHIDMMTCQLPGGWPSRFRQTCFYFFQVKVVSEGRFSLGEWHCGSVSHQLPLHALYAIGPSLRPEAEGMQFKLQKIVLMGNLLSI